MAKNLKVRKNYSNFFFTLDQLLLGKNLAAPVLRRYNILERERLWRTYMVVTTCPQPLCEKLCRIQQSKVVLNDYQHCKNTSSSAIANAVVEASWLRQLLHELHTHFHVLCWSTATTSACSTYLLTQYNINTPSILRSISTSSKNRLLLVMSTSCIFLHHHSMTTSSLKGFILLSS